MKYATNKTSDYNWLRRTLFHRVGVLGQKPTEYNVLCILFRIIRQQIFPERKTSPIWSTAHARNLIQKQIQAEQPAIRSFKRIAGCWFKELIKPAVFQRIGSLLLTLP